MNHRKMMIAESSLDELLDASEAGNASLGDHC
jgi:hypothetical protein